MSGKFVIKKKLVGNGPVFKFEVYENLGFFAGLTWSPWFVTYDEERAMEYTSQANSIAKRYGKLKLAGVYSCTVSPRSGEFGPQFNIYEPKGLFDKKLVHSTRTLEKAEAWAERATELSRKLA